MHKMTTLFKKNEKDLSLVVSTKAPENMWVFTESAAPTRKFDGTACAIIKGKLHKRYTIRKGKVAPAGAILCGDPDPNTGNSVCWIPCNPDEKSDRWHYEAFNKMKSHDDGTYELCGPKIQGNPERFDSHVLIRHGEKVLDIKDFSFESLKRYLEEHDIEGIVFHGKDGKMCKIRKSDFGIYRIKGGSQ